MFFLLFIIPDLPFMFPILYLIIHETCDCILIQLAIFLLVSLTSRQNDVKTQPKISSTELVFTHVELNVGESWVLSYHSHERDSR